MSMFSAVRHIYVYKSYGTRANLKVGQSCLPKRDRNYSQALQHRETPSELNRLNLGVAAEVEVPRTVAWDVWRRRRTGTGVNCD